MSSPAPDNQQTPAAAFDLRATASLLRAMSPLVWASHAAALIAASNHLWLPLLFWAVVLYYAIRIRLDADLLDLLATDPATNPTLLDHWLTTTKLRHTAPPRTIADRCHGARRLTRHLLYSFLGQCTATALLLLRSHL